MGTKSKNRNAAEVTLQPPRVMGTTPACNTGVVQIFGTLFLLLSPAPSPSEVCGCSCSSPARSLVHLHGCNLTDTGGKGCQEKAGEKAAAGTRSDRENTSCTGVKLLLHKIRSDQSSKVPRSRSCEFRVVAFDRDFCSP